MARTRRDKFFGAINDSYDALLSLVESGNNRGYRVSRVALKEARKGEREAVALARKFVEAPTQVFDLFEAIVDVQARAERRALELARDTLQGAGQFRREAQDAARQAIQANRAAGEVAVDALRDAYGRALARIRGEEEEAEPAPPPARPRPRRASRRRTAAPAVAAGNGAREEIAAGAP